MASSTASSRPGSSSRSGTANGMPAWRILSLARTSRLPIAAGEVRNAEAIVFASSPSTTCRISGARMPTSIAGCAQANISARRWSGMSAASAASSPSARSCNCAAATSPLRLRRAPSIIFRRATVSSHASGFAGQPLRGQSASAAAKASTARPRPRPHRACGPRERRRACRSCGAQPRPPCCAPARRLQRAHPFHLMHCSGGQNGRTSTTP